MQAVRRIGIISNPQKKEATLRLLRYLLPNAARFSISARLEHWTASLLDETALAAEDVAAEADVLLVLGGDGTLLRAVPSAVARALPLLGVNLGAVGFLTEVEPESLEEALQRLSVGEYDVERRMLLSVQPPEGPAQYALNDAVISRAAYGRLIRIEVYREQEMVDAYLGDGLIVATPTGSTAYSLSAGGPVIQPDMRCFALSPICPHTISVRSMVLSAEKPLCLTLCVQPGHDPEEPMMLSIDGQRTLPLRSGQEVLVSCADREARFIRFAPHPFFRLLRTKLTQWSQT